MFEKNKFSRSQNKIFSSHSLSHVKVYFVIFCVVPLTGWGPLRERKYRMHMILSVQFINVELFYPNIQLFGDKEEEEWVVRPTNMFRRGRRLSRTMVSDNGPKKVKKKWITFGFLERAYYLFICNCWSVKAVMRSGNVGKNIIVEERNE